MDILASAEILPQMASLFLAVHPQRIRIRRRYAAYGLPILKEEPPFLGFARYLRWTHKAFTTFMAIKITVKGLYIERVTY